MKNRIVISVIGTMILILFLSGCSSVLFPYDQPFIADTSTEDIGKVQNLIQPGSGSLMDISEDGNTLLVFSTSETLPVTHTIILLKTDTPGGSPESFLSSEKKLYHGIFSRDGKGIYYTEDASLENETLCQLVWTSLDRSSTKVLSDSDEDIITGLCALPNGDVLYSNDHNQIVRVNPDAKKTIYQIDEEYILSDLKYNPHTNSILFLASFENDNYQNLYEINEKDAKKTSPVLIGKNIIQFHIDPSNGNVCFLKQGNETNTLCLYNTKTKTQITLISDRLTDFCMDLKGEYIAVAIDCDNKKPGKYCKISIINLSEKKLFQLTSPKELSGKFILTNNNLFYAIKNNTANPEIYALQWQ